MQTFMQEIGKNIKSLKLGQVSDMQGIISTVKP